MSKPPDPFRWFDSSPEVIRLVVMMYVKYPLSLRNVEDLLFERGIDICHETVRSGARAGTADRGRPANRGHRRPCRGRQVRRTHAALPPSTDLRSSGDQARSLHPGRLGRAL